MEKGDKRSALTRMGVSGCMFLLVPAYPGCPGQTAIKWLLVVVVVVVCVTYGRGLVLLWRHCDSLCISSFTDEVIFAHNAPCASVPV